MPVKILFCYAHRDEALLNKLKMQLIPLLRHGLIDMWHDRDISAGTEWQREIDQHLNTAQIILLLISPEFMASDYCYGIELKQAIMRHERGDARVIPIILRRVYWERTLGRLQALPTNARPITSWSNRDEALFNVFQGIRRVVEELNTKLIESSSTKSDERALKDVQPFFSNLNTSNNSLHESQQKLLIWPELREYDTALLDANKTVYDLDIREGKVLSDSLPVHMNGGVGYTVVYKVSDWAVKCFYRHTYTRDLAIVPPLDIRDRYFAINEYISAYRLMLPFLVPQFWIERGISINGQDWPFIKSPFLYSLQLGTFLADHYQEQVIVSNLAKQWLTIITAFEALHIAHGSLDITNVLVCGTYPDVTLRLVDFDNMYVPTLRGRSIYERGQENFQPIKLDIRRFNDQMDRFSALVIYLSLIALAEDPQLWEQCGANEVTRLLLGAKDFQYLGNSPAYKLLRAKQGNLELQRCLDELVHSIEESRMPASLSSFLIKG